MALNAVSFNARGLNKSIKRRKLFRWLHLRKFDVIFLQETYSDASLEAFWRAEWNGQINFYQKITDSIRKCQTDNILIGGDFNCPLSALDKFGGKDIQFKKDVIHSVEARL